MIRIVQVGAQTDDPLGERNYEVFINNTLMGKFVHRRGDGLAVFLRRAADAVEAQRGMDCEQIAAAVARVLAAAKFTEVAGGEALEEM